MKGKIVDVHNEITVGLFGTCDNSKWRLPFIEKYNDVGIKFFNPDAGDNWHPGLIEIENYYLHSAEIILFPILAESLGSGSLGEVGFSVLNVHKNLHNGRTQFLIALIDDICTDERKTEEQRKLSTEERALVKSKLIEHVSPPFITLVDNLDKMMKQSINIYNFLKYDCPQKQ